MELFQPDKVFFSLPFYTAYAILFIQSAASLHSMLSTPRWYLGAHSHFVAPHPLTITEALPFLPFVFPSSPCHILINLICPPHPNAVWWQTSADQEFIFSSSTYYQFLPISPPLSPSQSSDLSISHQQFQNRWLHLAQGKKQWLWTTALRGAVFTLTLDLISWYPARNAICQWQKCINHIARCRYSHLRLSSWSHASFPPIRKTAKIKAHVN